MSAALAALGVSLSSPAWALSHGAGAAAIAADSPWAGVGSLSVNGASFTGTLIAPGYVLTAAHVVSGASAASIVFQTQGGETFSSLASAVYLNPGYTGSSVGNPAGDPTVHADLAIVQLASAAPADLPVYSLYAGDLDHQTISLVSYGRSATLATTGVNRVDLLFQDAEHVDQTYLFDVDGPDLGTNRLGADVPANGTLGAGVEAGLVDGDSGSAAFVQVGGRWQLAGINSFSLLFADGPATAGAYGSGGGGIVLAAHQDWIASIVTAPVPEPNTAWLMVSGLALLGTRLRRRFSPAA